MDAIFAHDEFVSSDKKVIEMGPDERMHIKEYEEDVCDDAHVRHEVKDRRPDTNATDVGTTPSFIELSHFEGVYAHL